LRAAKSATFETDKRHGQIYNNNPNGWSDDRFVAYRRLAFL